MFTGIITATSKIVSSEKVGNDLQVTFERPTDWDDLELGESISTNGVCLTVTAIHDDSYDCVLVPETLQRSSFGKQLPERVNLERSLTLQDRLDGHLVQGHVDVVGQVEAIDQSAGHEVTIGYNPEHQRLLIEKGSITIDGVALTISALSGINFTVALIPHTLENTTLGSLKVGNEVNLEFDVVGKYVVRNLELSR